MIIVTTRTPNEIYVKVVKNNSEVNVKSTEEFSVIESEKLTDSIIDLNNIGLVSFTEIKDDTKTEEESTDSGRRRNRRRNNSEETTEDSNKG